MNDYQGRGVKAVNGSKVKIIGKSFADIDLLEGENKKSVNIRLGIVENFDFNLLLGMDFNRKAGLVIDCNTDTIKVDNKEIKLLPYGQTVGKVPLNNLHLAQDVTIGPNETYYVKVSPNKENL